MPLDLETLLEDRDTKAPPLPEKGIPCQMIPGWIRWPLRVFFLPFVLLDLKMQKLARVLIRPPYKQVGSCKRRGKCCHYIMLRNTRGIIGKLHLLWNTEINGFFLRDKEPHLFENKKVLVMGCRYLQADGSCKHYHLRPLVCRQWPVIEHFGYPRILKGCGFSAIPRTPQNFTRQDK
jgi:hypothetical protein